MGRPPSDAREPATILLTDRFPDRRRPGQVVGSRTADGVVRQGVDREGVLSSDNHALRIQPLIEPGWGRAGIAYGPFRRAPGLTFAAFVLNGHNTSQAEPLPERFRERLERWWVGSETYRRRERLIQWLRSGRIARTVRQVRWWRRLRRDGAPVPPINENLAVGWFSVPAPGDPRTDGNAFVMHATGPENGELWARVGTACLPAIRGVQNLQTYYVVVLRDRGAAYYAAQVPAANGVTAYPLLRPLAIDAFHDDGMAYAGLHQSTLGQIGFRLDTRVYGVRIARLPEWSKWYGTAHAADLLQGSGLLAEQPADVGGRWVQARGAFTRGVEGTVPAGAESLAWLEPGVPSGLIHLVMEPGERAHEAVGLAWRVRDRDNFWCLSFGGEGCTVTVTERGTRVVVAQDPARTLNPGAVHAAQVLDDGHEIRVSLDGELLFAQGVGDDRLADASGVGLWGAGPDSGGRLARFEAHARAVQLPAALDLGSPWHRPAEELVVADDFEGPVADLAGTTTRVGGKAWRRQLGQGVVLAGEGRARIDATAERPNPGRTLYVVDWDHPEIADLEVEITPPGTARGQKEHGLCGFVFWQDPRNYVTINIWLHDSYGGASVSTFFQLAGFEDLYDAIWSNVGDRIVWGRPVRFRTVFDGMHYTAFVDDVPVLYRALTDVYRRCPRLAVKRVGLVANWEWGNDTGSVLRRFRARR